MKYTNYKCPVCHNVFNEDDDVVVCAECGTPYHRECYIQNGKCVNEDKHGTNEPIEVEFQDVIEEENQEQNADFLKSETSDNEAEKDNAQQIVQEIFEEINNNQNDLMLNGKHVSFYEAAIGKNQKYYIPRFMLIDKTKKGVSWNIAGFFVPLAWSLYRKMYKIAAVILALYVLVFGSLFYCIYTDDALTDAIVACQEEDPYYAEDILLYYSNSADVSLTEKQMTLYKLSVEYKFPLIVNIFKYVIIYGIRIAMGIYATNLYYKKLTKNIENIDKLDLSPDMKRSVLFRKCGTLPFIIAAIIGFFEWQMF